MKRYIVQLEDILTEVREQSGAMEYGRLTLELTFHQGEVSKYAVNKETPINRTRERKSGESP